MHGVDAALLQVKVAEAALYPTVGIAGFADQGVRLPGLPAGSKVLNGSIVGSVNIPIYDGGATFSSIRQAKEQVTPAGAVDRLAARQGASGRGRRLVRESRTRPAWCAPRKAQVQAAEVALAGVREEAKVGQRTTLDVLNAQQTLLQARLALVTAQHDQVVDSYTLLSSIGRLSMKMLGTRCRRIRSAHAFRSGQDQAIRRAHARRALDSLCSTHDPLRRALRLAQFRRRSPANRLVVARGFGRGLEIVMSVAASSNEDTEAEALRRAQRAHEPSMEEILASIRAIIADDREPAAPKPGPQIVYSSDAPVKPPLAPEPEAAPAPPTVVWTRKAEAPEPADAKRRRPRRRSLRGGAVAVGERRRGD